MKLNELCCGDSAIIETVDGGGSLRGRLLEMGLTPGTAVYLRKTAPMGDPIEITLRGYELTLRKEDAQMITLRDVAHGYQITGNCNGNCAACGQAKEV